MPLQIGITGFAKFTGLSKYFSMVKKDLGKNIRQKTNDFGNAVVSRAKEHYLTGGGSSKERLNVRTDRLRSSIRFLVEERDGGRALFLRVGSDVPYARIHEYGGTTPAHVIKPKKPGGWLRFFSGGKTVFARKVNHPGSVIPARPFLSTSIEDEAPDFFGNISGLLNRVARMVPKK